MTQKASDGHLLSNKYDFIWHNMQFNIWFGLVLWDRILRRPVPCIWTCQVANWLLRFKNVPHELTRLGTYYIHILSHKYNTNILEFYQESLEELKMYTIFLAVYPEWPMVTKSLWIQLEVQLIPYTILSTFWELIKWVKNMNRRVINP